MMNIFFLILISLFFAAGTGLAQQPDTLSDGDVSLKDQQKQLNDQLIDYARQQVNVLNAMKDYVGKEQYDSAWDYATDLPQFQQQMRRNRGDDDFNYSRARLDSLKLKTLETESKKNDLKMKVFDKNRKIPEWWDAAESEFSEKRRQVVQSGLRR